MPTDDNTPQPTLDEASWMPRAESDLTEEETQRYHSLERMLLTASATGLDGTEQAAPDATRYRVERVLGRGGVGEVLLVHDLLLEREVAVKTLQADHPGARRAFWHEARVTATLDHPSIMPVYDAGTLAGRGPYFAMKRVRGRDLYHLMVSGEAPPLRRRLEWFVRACEAVAYAHDRGWLHRDLKPENIMVGPYGEVLVADWGLAWTTESPSSAPAAGTPNYMPPEQATGASPHPTADVYALGGTLWFLLTEEVPWSHHSVEAMLAQLRAGRGFVPPPGKTPPELHSIVRKALAASPDQRYPDVPHMVTDIEAWLDGREVRAHRYSLTQRSLRWADRHRRRLLVGASVVVVLSAVLAVSGVTTGFVVWRSLLVAESARATSERAEADARAAETRTQEALQEALVANAAARVALGDVNGAAAVLEQAREFGSSPLVDLAAIDVVGRGLTPVYRLPLDVTPVDVRLVEGSVWALTDEGWVMFSLRNGSETSRGPVRGQPIAWLSDGSVLVHEPDRLLRMTIDGDVLAEGPGPAATERVTLAGEANGELWLQSFASTGNGRLMRTGLDLVARDVPDALRGGHLHEASHDGRGVWTETRNPDRTRQGFLVELATGRRLAPLPSMLVAWHGERVLVQDKSDLCALHTSTASVGGCVRSAGAYRWTASEGDLVIASESGEITLHSPVDASVSTRLLGADGRAAAVHAVDGWVASVMPGAVVVWAAPDVPDWGGVGGERTGDAALHPGGRLVALHVDRRVQVVDGPTGVTLAVFDEAPGLVGLDWSRDGRALLVSRRGADSLALSLEGGPPVALPSGRVAPWGDGLVVHDHKAQQLVFLDQTGKDLQKPMALPGSTWTAVPLDDGSVILGANSRRGPVLGVRVLPDGDIERWMGASSDYLGFGATTLSGGRVAFCQQDGTLVVRNPDGESESWRWQREPLLDAAQLSTNDALAVVDFSGRLHLLRDAAHPYTAPVTDTLRFATVADNHLLLTGGPGVQRRRMDPWPADSIVGRLLQARSFRLAAEHGELSPEDRLSLAIVSRKGLEVALNGRNDPTAMLLRRWEQAGEPVELR